MGTAKNPHSPQADQRLQKQTGEQHGSLKREQLDDRSMPEKDLARGSEPDTAGSSRNRR
jgi:hypothetical protein